MDSVIANVERSELRELIRCVLIRPEDELEYCEILAEHSEEGYSHFEAIRFDGKKLALRVAEILNIDIEDSPVSKVTEAEKKVDSNDPDLDDDGFPTEPGNYLVTYVLDVDGRKTDKRTELCEVCDDEHGLLARSLMFAYLSPIQGDWFPLRHFHGLLEDLRDMQDAGDAEFQWQKLVTEAQLNPPQKKEG